ncbi:hypothetical protein Nepgr_030109 [Nepenthes gracilis]|uniref:Uncharacterized protein n=1 Tax=Nepenthes gracilis TaxID=150966 RepID=A0AAD3TG54_NEPGR|nr:hypothetical protein Nepgr_030109 [Nepenthes gracilis]
MVSLCQFAAQAYAEDLFISDVLCACASVFEDLEGCWCHLFVAGFDEAQASCFFLLFGLGEHGVALLGAIDPDAVGVSSCLLMPRVRKVLAFGDSVVGDVVALCYVVSLKGSAARLHFNFCRLVCICLVVSVGSLCSAISFAAVLSSLPGGFQPGFHPLVELGLPLCFCRIGCLLMLPGWLWLAC